MIKVLLPTDFSSTANNAFLYALHLCKNYNGELLVLHSYAPHIVSGNISTELVDNAQLGNTLNKFDYFKDQVKMMRTIAEVNNLDQVSVKFIMEEGELVQNIQEITKRDPLHLVVMGTTGNSGFENKLLGSKTAAVIKNVTIPVLSIPHFAKFEGIDAIGFTTIYDEEDAKILHEIIPYTKYSTADIYCIHVNKPNEKKNVQEIAEWKEQFKDEQIFFIEKNEDNIVKGVFDFIEEHSIDLVSCITRNKSFFDRLFERSIAEKLSYHKRIPLLTFHEGMFNE